MRSNNSSGWSLVKLALCAVLAAGSACSSASPGSGTIGPEGGTVTGPDSAKVTIPKAAVPAETRLTIEKVTSGAPPLPGGATSQGGLYAFTPHGQAFAAPVTVSIPFSGTFSSSLQLMTAPPGGPWSVVTGARRSGATLEAEVSHFSYFGVVQAEPADAGTTAPLNGSWLIVGFVCDGGVFDAGGMVATTFTFDGGAAVITNQYCTVQTTVTYPASGQMEWVIVDTTCPGSPADGGTCNGTRHPSAYVVNGTTLTLTESPAPLCEYYCAGMHKVTTFQKQ